MEYLNVRLEIISIAKTFNQMGLSVGTSGNVSVLVEESFFNYPIWAPIRRIESG